MKTFKGISVFSGVAIGPLHFYRRESQSIERREIQDPQARVLWAHAGFERPEKVAELLRRHKHLWADLAFRSEHGSGGQGGDHGDGAALAALAAEGARMLEDGRLRRPADLDALAVLSGLMARSLGGPFHQADRRGLLLLRADLRKCTGAVFAVSPEIDRRIAEGARFGL